MKTDRLFEQFGNYFDLAGRLCIAFIFIRSPIRKILGYERFESMLEEHGLAAELLPLVIVFEIGCGLAMALGWQTRFAAFLLAGFTALAAFIFHWDWESHFSVYLLFSKNIVIFGGLLFIAGHGAKTYSLDSYFASKKQQSAH
jgi:putative oxidoreductase